MPSPLTLRGIALAMVAAISPSSAHATGYNRGMEFVLPAIAVAFGAFFIWLVVRIVNRRISLVPKGILKNKKSLVAAIVALGLLAGSLVDTQHPTLAVVVMLVGVSLALAVARR